MRTFNILLISLLSIFTFNCNALSDNNESEVPDALVWVSHTSGFQCGDITYQSIDEATLFLNKNDIQVYNSAEESVPVCAACGCPNSLFYLAEIDSLDLNAATELGWRHAPDFEKADR